MFYYFIRKIIFLIEPEVAHKLILKYLYSQHIQKIINFFLQPLPKKKIKCMGLIFDNVLGTAAGLDKNGEYIDVISKLGFSFIELGTVTPIAQIGNPKPRLFRLIHMEGIINRMGFNNLGVDNLIKNIKKSDFKGIIGINIGKNKDTSIQNAINDYLICIEKTYCYASYIAVNISSPNTTNLRNLQYGTMFDQLLMHIKKKQTEMCRKYSKYVPIAIKISPDLSTTEIIHISKKLIEYKIDAVIATNTTIDYSLIDNKKNNQKQNGGISGLPLQKKSTEIIHILSKILKNKIPIIGVGGINSVDSAQEKIQAGATLIQMYSGLIFHGPAIIRKIIRKV
ncbi:quinone-dependent dihydroorotate dehydrogenase [Buchnera aphidicola]|uniref:quinone-dependent dihydroorotate dehydrogenase n=1 Tax=Buchnera aphidicola TaxID=9 RepID=UPI00346410B6